MTDKLIVFGQVKRKLTSQLVPVHYVYEYEEDRAAVQTYQEVIDIVEPYSSIQKWRKSPISVTEK